MRTTRPEITVPTLQGNAVVQAPVLETNVRPEGVGSVTTTFAASLGPLLRTSIVKLTKSPVNACDGPLFVSLMSALGVLPLGGTMFVVDVAELLPLFGSPIPDDTLAVFVTCVPVKFAGTLNVEVIVALVFGLSVPMLHGNGVAHAPLFETNVVPAGVASVTVTFGAATPPLFVMVIV